MDYPPFLFMLILVAIEIKVRKNCQCDFELLNDHLAVFAIKNKRQFNASVGDE